MKRPLEWSALCFEWSAILFEQSALPFERLTTFFEQSARFIEQSAPLFEQSAPLIEQSLQLLPKKPGTAINEITYSGYNRQLIFPFQLLNFFFQCIDNLTCAFVSDHFYVFFANRLACFAKRFTLVTGQFIDFNITFLFNCF